MLKELRIMESGIDNRNTAEKLLQKLYSDKNKADSDRAKIQPLEAEIKSSESELRKSEKKLADCKRQLDTINHDSTTSNINAKIDDLNKKIRLQEKYIEDTKTQVGKEMTDKQVRESERIANKRDAKLARVQNSIKETLTDYEQKALEFAEQRYNVNDAADDKIRESNGRYKEVEDHSNTKIAEYKGMINDTYAAYADQIDHWNAKIEAIKSKHHPAISDAQQKMDDIKEEWDSVDCSIQEERNRAVRSYNSQIQNLNSEYSRVDKDFRRQIKEAEKAGKATTRLSNSRTSQLNKIQTEITKLENNISKENAKMQTKKEQNDQKYSKKLDSATSAYNTAVNKMNAELQSPQSFLNALVKERDGKVRTAQGVIDQYKIDITNADDTRNREISEQESIRSSKLDAIKSNMVTYIKNNDNCFDETLNEAYKPFEALQENLDKANEYKDLLIQNIGESKFNKKYDEVTARIHNMEYDELECLAEIMSQASFDSIPKTTNTKMMLGIGAGLGVVIALLLYFFMKHNIVLSIIGFGVALVVLFFINKSAIEEPLDKVSKFIAIVSGYTELDAIKQYSDDKTTEIELNKLTGTGDNLFKSKTATKAIYDEYEEKMSDLMYRIMTEKQQEIINRCSKFEDEIARLNSEIANAEKLKSNTSSNNMTKKYELETAISETTSLADELRSKLDKLHSQLDTSRKSVEFFDTEYKSCIEEIDNIIPDISKTKAILSDSIYMIPDDDKKVDSAGHKYINHIEHDKKPFVILYDSTLADCSAKAYKEALGDITNSIVLDLMLAFRRINSKDIYEQNVIDTIASGNAFKDPRIKNILSIDTVVGSQYAMANKLAQIDKQKERVYQTGGNIDSINASRIDSGERPMKYNIMYFIVNPNSDDSMDESMNSVLVNSDTFGFIPVFICDMTKYINGISKDRNIYKDISMVTTNVIIFDTTKYSIVSL